MPVEFLELIIAIVGAVVVGALVGGLIHWRQKSDGSEPSALQDFAP